MAEPRILAAICTSRQPAEVRGPLAELAAQAAAVEGAGVLLVTSGLDAAAHAEHERLGAEIGARVLRAASGLSVARNRALAEAGESDVVAYIDDDAIPRAEWLERLARHWAELPADVACIGGAIDPRWLTSPPAWVSGRIHVAYSLLDLGPDLVELTPSAGEGVWGANISFRAGPLRAVGAFDLAHGAWGEVPLVGEEAVAQRRLEAAGKRILYAGDVRVEHLISPDRLTLRNLARRERWRGVSAVINGWRSPGTGAPRALRAGTGLALAAAARKWGLAGERWARTFRELGVASAPLARRRLRRRGWPG